MTDKKSIPHERAINLLKNFGLSENEALVYNYLLERGQEVRGSKIAAGLALHRQYVYTALAKLIEAGLVEAILYGQQKRYRALPPANIEKIARKRVVDAEEVVRELNTFSTIGHEQDFEVVQGERAIQKYEIDRVKTATPGSVQHFVGGGSEHFKRVMGDAYYDYAALVKEKKIASQYIGTEHEIELGKFYDKEQKLFDFHLLKNLPQSLVNIMIMGDTLSFYTYANPPILYVVKSKVVAESYKKFFEMLWAMAEKPAL